MSTQTQMKIVIADNHDLIIDGLARMIGDRNISQTIYKAHNGREALDLAITHTPDLIISDYKMEEFNGLELLIRVRQEALKAKFLVISMVNEAAIVEKLIEHGVDGFMNKESPVDEMIYGISEIRKGKKYFCRITQEALKEARKSNQSEIFLSGRELEVLKMVLEEKKNQQIAEELHIHVSTVETHKKNLIRKLGVKSSIGLVRYALENNLF